MALLRFRLVRTLRRSTAQTKPRGTPRQARTWPSKQGNNAPRRTTQREGRRSRVLHKQNTSPSSGQAALSFISPPPVTPPIPPRHNAEIKKAKAKTKRHHGKQTGRPRFNASKITTLQRQKKKKKDSLAPKNPSHGWPNGTSYT